MNNVISYTIVGIDQVSAPIRHVIRSVDHLSTAFKGASLAMKASLIIMALQAIVTVIQTAQAAWAKWTMVDDLKAAKEETNRLYEGLKKAGDVGFERLTRQLEAAEKVLNRMQAERNNRASGAAAVESARSDLRGAQIEATPAAGVTFGGAEAERKRRVALDAAKNDAQKVITDQWNASEKARGDESTALINARDKRRAALDFEQQAQERKSRFIGMGAGQGGFAQIQNDKEHLALLKQQADEAESQAQIAFDQAQAERRKLTVAEQNAALIAQNAQNTYDQAKLDEKAQQDQKEAAGRTSQRKAQLGIVKAQIQEQADRDAESAAFGAELAGNRLKRIMGGRRGMDKGPEDAILGAGDLPKGAADIEAGAGLEDRYRMFFDRGSAKGYVGDQRAAARRLESLQRAAEHAASGNRRKAAQKLLDDLGAAQAARAEQDKLDKDAKRAAVEAAVSLKNIEKELTLT